jgi:hypothetical protein
MRASLHSIHKAQNALCKGPSRHLPCSRVYAVWIECSVSVPTQKTRTSWAQCPFSSSIQAASRTWVSGRDKDKGRVFRPPPAIQPGYSSSHTHTSVTQAVSLLPAFSSPSDGHLQPAPQRAPLNLAQPAHLGTRPVSLERHIYRMTTRIRSPSGSRYAGEGSAGEACDCAATGRPLPGILARQGCTSCRAPI